MGLAIQPAPLRKTMNAEEIVGRKQVELENLNVEYNNLLVVLHKVVNGELDSENVTVDLEKRSWAITQNQTE